MNIPSWASQYIRAERVQLIEQAVVAAEKNTTGEIVPMIVRRSSTVGHVPVIMSLFMIVIWLIADHVFLGFGEFSVWSWVVCVGLVGLSHFLCRFDCFQRMFTTNQDLEHQVRVRAEIEFFEHGAHQTLSRTGILLFVSLMERRVVVLGDQAINARIQSETWAEVCSLLIDGIKNANMGVAFKNAVEKCGEILAKDFPQTGEPDQISNQLIIKE